MPTTKKSVTAADLDAAVFTYYMRKGDAATVSEIAEELGCSTRTVHKLLNNNACRSICRDKSVPIRSKSNGTIIGHKNVDAYFPSCSDLRQRLIHFICEDDDVRITADWLETFCKVVTDPDTYTEYRAEYVAFICEQGLWNAYAFTCKPWQRLRGVNTRGDVRMLLRGLDLRTQLLESKR